MTPPTLRELCEQATKGPRIHIQGERIVFTKLNDGCRGVPILSVEHAYHDGWQADLDLAARFSPETALAVLICLKRCKEQIAGQQAWNWQDRVKEINRTIALLNGAAKE